MSESPHTEHTLQMAQRLTPEGLAVLDELERVAREGIEGRGELIRLLGAATRGDMVILADILDAWGREGREDAL
jgi:hypothetical protein